ncbi:MAG: phosphomannomutase/phosphoglucomutase [Candidatus Nanohaloarchaea archaeon]
MTSFFHAYDLRGTFPEEIGEEEAEKVGKAFGTFMEGKILVGRDGRSHGKKVTEAFLDGVMSTGTDVLDAGRVPTPVIYYGTRELQVAGSAVVTASHNPPEYTGFKFCKQDALAMSREGGMERIEEIYEQEAFDEGTGTRREVELVQDYIEFVASKIQLEAEVSVAVNFGNGIASAVGEELLEVIGCEVDGMNDTVDGEFPNHLPDPGSQEAQEQLRDFMGDQELGILIDGDGDRAGFMVDGDYIEEDRVLSLFAVESLEREKGKVVHDLRASKLVPEKVRENGGKPVETRVGHTFISEKIHSDSDIVFAGELSGHYYFPAFDVPYDDGLFAAALMCRIASERDLEEAFSGMPEYPVSPELRIDCPEDAKQEVVEKVRERFSDHRLSTVDGVKIYFDGGWALVRPSNTEPKMSVRCEADTEERLGEILEMVESSVRSFIDEA